LLTPAVRHHVYSLLTALLLVGVAFVLTQWAASHWNTVTLFFFLTAVVFCSWQGGALYGLLVTFLSALLSARFIFQPTHSNLILSPADMVRWGLFVLIALMINSVHAVINKSKAVAQRSEQRLTLAIESAHMGVWDYHLLTHEFWWSKTLQTIYARPAEEFPRTYGRFFSLIHFDDQPLFNRAITRTIDEGTDYEIEHRILLPDKSVRWVNTRGRVIFSKSNRAERIVGVVTDITARKLEEQGSPFDREPSDERMPSQSLRA
jgi:PAS domain S-box-containing protein